MNPVILLFLTSVLAKIKEEEKKLKVAMAIITLLSYL
jgi:hypothetical protein